jgi:polysaccharide export outer membrane protein
LKLAIPILVLALPLIAAAADVDAYSGYLLGPMDELAIKAAGMGENEKGKDRDAIPVRIDPSGNIDVLMVGTVHAGGLTVSELRAQLTDRFRKFVRDPKVTVEVAKFRNQTVTVIGAVDKPGGQEVEGPKRLLDLIALAGGFTKAAGTKITITRYQESGTLPLSGARQDMSAGCMIGEVDIAQLTAKADPAVNIIVRSGDVISVSQADLIYVIGEVNQPGGYAFDSHTKVTVMSALGMAGGPKITASTKDVTLLRKTGEGNKRERIPQNVTKIMDGKAPDIPLQPEDVLVVSLSTERAARMKSIDTFVPIFGIEIYRVSVGNTGTTTTVATPSSTPAKP